MKSKLFFIILVLLFPTILFSQEYEIKVNIKGVSDTVIYLGHHYGDRKLVVDTTEIDSRGRAVFTGDKELHNGIYLIVMPSRGMVYFEFLMTDNKKFTLSTDTTNFVENMRVRGCKENEVFNKYQRFMGNLQKKRMDLNEKMEKYADDEDMMEKLRDQAQKLNKERIDYVDNIMDKHPNFFFTTILMAMKDIEIPDAPTDENGEVIDPDFQYRFFKHHYFDNIDFSERGLIRTPIYQSKIDHYFQRMVIPNPDSLRMETDRVIGLAYEAGDSLMFRFTLSHLLRHFETSNIMGHDAVFVHIAEQWYLSGKAKWATEEFLERLTERVLRISPNLIGNITPNLMRMQTIDDRFVSLHQVEADYTILVFWEPECGHCRRVIPALLKELQDTLADMNIKVVALYTQYDREQWKEFVDKYELYDENWINIWDGPRPHSNFRNLYDIYSTPVIYVLADDKRIVAKRVNVDDIKVIIKHDKKDQERKQNND